MLLIETEREEDGRWLAEVPALPGVMTPSELLRGFSITAGTRLG